MVGKWVENPIKSIKNDQKRSQQSENGSRKFEKKTKKRKIDGASNPVAKIDEKSSMNSSDEIIR